MPVKLAIKAWHDKSRFSPLLQAYGVSCQSQKSSVELHNVEEQPNEIFEAKAEWLFAETLGARVPLLPPLAADGGLAQPLEMVSPLHHPPIPIQKSLQYAYA